MLICINYHYIRENFKTKYPSIFGITPKEFRNQLEELAKLGNFISGSQLGHFVQENKKLRGVNFLITFDDGLQEQFELAYPILKEMGIPAMFFPNTATLRDRSRVEMVHKIHLIRSEIDPNIILQQTQPHLTASILGRMEEIRTKGIAHYRYDIPETAELKYLLNFELENAVLKQIIDEIFSQNFNTTQVNRELYINSDALGALAKKGLIGSHGETHVPLGLQSETVKLTEICGSYDYIMEHTGYAPVGFSFPYGNKESASGCNNILKMAGYKFALTMERAINQDLRQPFGLSRFDNNDMPLGKSFSFSLSKELLKYPKRKWKTQE